MPWYGDLKWDELALGQEDEQKAPQSPFGPDNDRAIFEQATKALSTIAAEYKWVFTMMWRTARYRFPAGYPVHYDMNDEVKGRIPLPETFLEETLAVMIFRDNQRDAPNAQERKQPDDNWFWSHSSVYDGFKKMGLLGLFIDGESFDESFWQDSQFYSSGWRTKYLVSFDFGCLLNLNIDLNEVFREDHLKKCLPVDILAESDNSITATPEPDGVQQDPGEIKRLWIELLESTYDTQEIERQVFGNIVDEMDRKIAQLESENMTLRNENMALRNENSKLKGNSSRMGVDTTNEP
ncbi:hypothetical protein OQA88_6709 [Cercophora sp. LCS_1]